VTGKSAASTARLAVGAQRAEDSHSRKTKRESRVAD
jgi:hypothetical protein